MGSWSPFPRWSANTTASCGPRPEHASARHQCEPDWYRCVEQSIGRGYAQRCALASLASPRLEAHARGGGGWSRTACVRGGAGGVRVRQHSRNSAPTNSESGSESSAGTCRHRTEHPVNPWCQRRAGRARFGRSIPHAARSVCFPTRLDVCEAGGARISFFRALQASCSYSAGEGEGLVSVRVW